jgi:hypothetical protein
MTCDELIEKPTVFERAAAAHFIESVRHDERVRFAQRQQHRRHEIQCQCSGGAHPQIAVDQHEA